MADQPDGEADSGGPRSGGDGLRRGDVGAVLARVGVALGAFLLVTLVCRLAGWDPSWYGVLTGFAAYLGFDRLMARRRERAERDAGPGPAR